jgi:hypothetical protein
VHTGSFAPLSFRADDALHARGRWLCRHCDEHPPYGPYGCWDWAYYVPALTGPLWLALWLGLAASSPSQCRWVGEAERLYLAATVRAEGAEATGAEGPKRVRVKPLALVLSAPVRDRRRFPRVTQPVAFIHS